ncbi:MAG: hypothetical protein ACRETQ_05515, partial [Gammaproteobacteria bacterium]
MQKAVRQVLAGGLTAIVGCGAFAVTAVAAEQQDQAGTAQTSQTSNSATPTQLNMVEVTGTRIKRTSVETAQPIVVITAK